MRESSHFPKCSFAPFFSNQASSYQSVALLNMQLLAAFMSVILEEGEGVVHIFKTLTHIERTNRDASPEEGKVKITIESVRKGR